MKTYKLALFILLSIFSTALLAQDWANTARFKDENAKLSPPAAGEQRVVFMGN